MTSTESRTMRILCCHAAGEAGSRTSELIAELDASMPHELVLADSAKAGFPNFSGSPGPARLIGLARAMAGFDLIATFGRGAISVAMAHRVFGQSFHLPPLVHHEIDLASEAKGEFALGRNLYRRIALGSAHSVIVESHTVARAAQQHWQVPANKLRCIALGIQTESYCQATSPDRIPGLIKRDGELWLGATAEGASIADLRELINAFAQLPKDWQLVMVGQVDARDMLDQETDRLQISHRVHLPGVIADRAEAFALFDLYAAAPCGMAFPTSTARAMAAGLAVCAIRQDESAQLLAEENAAYLASGSDAQAMARALLQLAIDPAGRAKAGKANRARAKARFDRTHQLDAYVAAYSAALSAQS